MYFRILLISRNGVSKLVLHEMYCAFVLLFIVEASDNDISFISAVTFFISFLVGHPAFLYETISFGQEFATF